MKVMLKRKDDSIKPLHNIKSIKYEEGKAILLFMRGTEKTVEPDRIVEILDDNSIRCEMYECRFCQDRKCRLQQINVNEGLSINQHGVCVSFEEEED